MQGTTEIPKLKQIVDTTGAGDAFLAGLISQLIFFGCPSDKSVIDKSVEELSKVAQPLSSKLYKTDQPESEPDKGEGKSDEAVDAEFKEVDEEKDKS